MREIRTYGSEGGEARAFPTPIQPDQRPRRNSRSRSARDSFTQVGRPWLH